jgi:serine/threonine-protein kinase
MIEPKRLGKYEIIEEIGRGGFATVYRALDTTLEREVAVKVLNPLLLQDPTWARRFRREAKAVARLQHNHIVTIYEIGEEQGQLFIAMELVKGPSLRDLINERGPLTWDQALYILAQVASALDYAHREGIVHRDLKPGNILVDPRRGALLTDFGLARLVGESSMSTSISGGVVGTPSYIAPEIWDEGAAEVPADIYAFGCIVYEMLTGEVLFEGATPLQTMRAHDKGPQFPTQWPEGVPGGLEAVLSKALAREPPDRFASAGQMVDALGRLGSRDRKVPLVIISPRQPREPEMIPIPAGQFLMGSDPKSDRNAGKLEQPQRRLHLPDYYIARTPVTNAQYLVFAQAASRAALSNWKSGHPPKGKEYHPVVNVSWYDAVAYCEWLAGVTGRPYHLPSEAEWEKAARGTEGLIYPWGNQWDPGRCNNEESGIDDTTRVGSYSPRGDSPYGCADMVGNVWEWTSSQYKPYPYDATSGREDLEAGHLRVLRGGAYSGSARYVRCAYRSRNHPVVRYDFLGFRVAASPA